MGDLFEKFVRGFASYELRDQASVSATILDWELAASANADTSLLPVMKTDVFLRWHDTAITVCECKFYEQPLIRHPHAFHDRLRSEHLYQLMTYVRAAERATGTKPKALLLYAMSGQCISESWTLEGYPLQIFTLDLSMKWVDLRESLLAVLWGRAA